MSSPDIPTAAQALAMIQTWDDKPSDQRRNLRTAVKTYCRLGGSKRPPEIVRLDPARCLPEVDAARASALGISDKSLRNVRSGLRYVLRRCGLLAPVRERNPVDDPRWAELIGQLPARFHPHRLRAFLEFCAARDIVPEAVTNDTLVAYLDRRQAERGGDNNRADVREAARQWNKMAKALPGWPQIELALPPDPDRTLSPPLATYPVSLQREVTEFVDWCRGSGEEFFGEEADVREPMSEASIQTRLTGLRLFLWGAVETGTPAEEMDGLEWLMRSDVRKRSMRWNRERLGGKVTAGLATIADTLPTVAAFLNRPEAERAVLRQALRAYRPKRQKEITERNARLLDRLTDPVARGKLLKLPFKLMERAREIRDGWVSHEGIDHAPKSMEACWLAAVAVAVEIELNLPLRVSDLTQLTLDEELRIQRQRRGSPTAFLRVTANKNDQVVETILDEESAELLQEYVDAFRPLGPHPETRWLFPNRDTAGHARAPQGFSAAIMEELEKELGFHMTVQSFRCFAATVIMEMNPHAIEDVRLILGHAGFAMAERHYRRVNRHAAARRLSAGLRSLRRDTQLQAAAPSFRPPRKDRGMPRLGGRS
ncbi:hypothetical protein [Sediminicoccus rosea]|uniref:Tyr recombinase domain-containing protein n=1 Tax=Sediminicoccus rosea TaxID=1225128 RepID=A0ABZ0PEA2_9PROT|nr:hypothetical protein [Sediminicoccus rosea]WPB83960.1 hypothetical protein R9Z33_17845 [Sediminicoccus rosea]